MVVVMIGNGVQVEAAETVMLLFLSIRLTTLGTSRTFVYSHLHFDIGHNDNQIVQVWLM